MPRACRLLSPSLFDNNHSMIVVRWKVDRNQQTVVGFLVKLKC